MSIEALAAALEKAIGGNSEAQTVKNWLDSGYPPLNKVISGRYDGGLPYGRIIEMFGPSSSGKTALATMFMISAQKAGGVAIFLDHEGSFDVNLAKNMGLSDHPGKWVYKRPRTWEESNTIAMKAADLIRGGKYIDPEAPILVVFDSIAAMIPKSVFEKGIDEYSMNDTTALARVTSTTLKAINQVAGDLNVIMLYLNQTRTKPGVMYGDPTTTPGGQAVEFYSSVRLALGRKRVVEGSGSDKETIGQLITIETKKNKLNRPFQTTDIRLKFLETGGARFDLTTGMLDHLVSLGVLTSSGPRITWTDGKSYFKQHLADKIDSEGLYEELVKMLPAEPAVVA